MLKGTLNDEQFLVYLIRIATDYVICPGLKIAPNVGSTVIRSWGFPFDRTDSKHCCIIHKPRNRKQMPDSDLHDVCCRCKKLHHKMKTMSKERERNVKRCISNSSKCNWRYLSPTSRKMRWRTVTSAVRRHEKEVKRLNKKLQVPLSPQFKNELDEIFDKAKTAREGKGREGGKEKSSS